MKTRTIIGRILENLVKRAKLRVNVSGKDFSFSKDESVIYTVAETKFGFQVTINGKYKLDLESKADIKDIFK